MQVGLLAQRAGYHALDLYGLTSAAQWAAAAAASVRNAAALETAMLRVILGATGIKLVARGPAVPWRHSQAWGMDAAGMGPPHPPCACHAAHVTNCTIPLGRPHGSMPGRPWRRMRRLLPSSRARCACHQPRL